MPPVLVPVLMMTAPTLSELRDLSSRIAQADACSRAAVPEVDWISAGAESPGTEGAAAEGAGPQGASAEGVSAEGVSAEGASAGEEGAGVEGTGTGVGAGAGPGAGAGAGSEDGGPEDASTEGARVEGASAGVESPGAEGARFSRGHGVLDASMRKPAAAAAAASTSANAAAAAAAAAAELDALVEGAILALCGGAGLCSRLPTLAHSKMCECSCCTALNARLHLVHLNCCWSDWSYSVNGKGASSY